MRIDGELFSASKSGYYLDMSIVPADQVVPAEESKMVKVAGYPSGSWINLVGWSPDSKFVCFSTRSPGGLNDPPRLPLDLWIADASTGHASQILGGDKQRLNTIFEDYLFLDDRTIIACLVPSDYEASGGMKKVPVKPTVLGPRIEDNSKVVKTSQSRTYPDLLKDAHDVELFEYYGSSEIAIIDLDNSGKQPKKIGPPRVYTDILSSPDGNYLLVTWLDKPFATTVPCGRFPRVTQLWDRNGKCLREMANLPLAEDIPISFNSVRKGPRSMTWRSDKASEIYWIEAQDGGDASVVVSPRDIIYSLPVTQSVAQDVPRILAKTDLRCGGVAWGNDDLALVYESWWKTRRSIVSIIAPGNPGAGSKVLFDRNYEDSYSDPGVPLTRRSRWGTGILALVDGGRKLLTQGQGASPEGNRPFLDLLDLDKPEEKSRIWQSRTDANESLGGIFLSSEQDEAQPEIILQGLKMLLSRETSKDPPQSYLVTFAQDSSSSSSSTSTSSSPITFSERQLTRYPHPYPQLLDMKREVIRYSRSDGVTLTATLYLPPGYVKERDGPLPCLFWAYPREFKSKEAAGQNTRSPHQFAYLGSSSPTLWVARGYAVLDGPALPIVAEGEEEPNDTFVEQLVAGAKAAIEYCSGPERGEVDPKRVTVAGHSYGAFMAANLMAHAPSLFACGIARTGAYNRTLTPFGFQSEERTIWQAPDVYSRMSPFYSADKIKNPLLLIHGQDDDNPGTFPLQSERMYQALKGHGATCRLVLLPHEAHSHRARENVLHAVYEADQWMERYAGFNRVEEEGEERLQSSSSQ